MGSKSFSVNWSEVVKILKGSLFVGATAAAIYLVDNAAYLDFGAMTVFLVPIVTTVLQSLVTWLKDNSK